MSDPLDPLRAAFGSAAPEHFEWQTSAPYVSEREAELVGAAFRPLGRRVLDVGCGQGATLFHLGAPPGAIGLDLFPDRLRLAAERVPRCGFVAGSALALPFRDGSFDHVLVRDVVHHLERPEALVDECRRVLTVGGRLDVLEPCGNNPLIVAHALSRREERGELRSRERHLRRVLDRGFVVEDVRRHQPLPLHRVVLHPELGLPALGGIPLARLALAGAERVAGVVLPRVLWAYVHVRARRAG